MTNLMKIRVSCINPPSYGGMFEYFLGLVVIAQVKHPIPSRTRPLSTVALMVLRLKTWESKSLPNLVSIRTRSQNDIIKLKPPLGRLFAF